MADGLQNCEFCHSPAHVWFNCPKKPDGWKPERLKKSTPGSAPKFESYTTAVPAGEMVKVNAMVDAMRQPVPQGLVLVLKEELTTRGAPRQRAPKGTFDRKAYQREAARKRRAATKAKNAGPSP